MTRQLLQTFSIRILQAPGPNQKWVADISYIWTLEGWIYLACIIDLYSRRLVGKDLPLRALNQAIILHQPAEGIIHQCDRGSQYCSNACQKLLQKHGFQVSMSGKGNCHDNAAMEVSSKPPRRNSSGEQYS